MKITRWDLADHIKTEEDATKYLEAAFEDGDPALIQAVLGDIARSKGMADIARKIGVGRESLYKSLKLGGNPSFATVLKVIKLLGLSLKVKKPRKRTKGSQHAEPGGAVGM